MIDPSLFTVQRLLDALLSDDFGNRDAWRRLAEIVPNYMPPFPSAETRARTVVRCGSQFLRYSKGPHQGHFWDVYGDDYGTPELALIALLKVTP